MAERNHKEGMKGDLLTGFEQRKSSMLIMKHRRDSVKQQSGNVAY